MVIILVAVDISDVITQHQFHQFPKIKLSQILGFPAPLLPEAHVLLHW